MTPAPSPRLDGLLAREADIAVVFRRGPSKRTRLLRWNLATDEVEPGQWIGGRVYSRRCDLSPDGALLVGAFTNYSRSAAQARTERGEPAYDGWTAVSRPPYFTALAVWEGEGAWNGGGLWRGPRELALNLPDAPSERTGPLAVSPLDLPRSEDEPIHTMRLEASGWRTIQSPEVRETNPEWRERARALNEAVARGVGPDPSTFAEFFALMQNTLPEYETVREGRMEKPIRRGVLVRATNGPAERWSLLDEAGRAYLEFRPEPFHPQWLDVDHRGRVVYGDRGCLWAWSDFPDGAPTMIADLNGMAFAPMEAPSWAREWPF